MTSPLYGAVAAIAAGDTPYYVRGQSPDGEEALALRAIVAAAEAAGISPAEIDGFASYAEDQNDPTRLATALGTREINWSSMVWGGGGGGSAGAIGAAAAAIVAGQARTVVVYRALAQRDSGRLNEAVGHGYFGRYYAEQGVLTPVQLCALRTQRLIEKGGVAPSALEAVVRADYHHAQSNPRAQGFGRPIDPAAYRDARMIAEPLRLLDCSRENDAAGAIILIAADRAADLVERPVYLLGAAQGADHGRGENWENDPDYASSGYRRLGARLWRDTGLSANDIDVVQLYENFSGPAVSTLIDLGFCTAESAGDVLTFENLLARGGRLPINTSGGLIGEGNVHGMGAAVEAVRQLQGTSPNPVEQARTCLVTGGPAAPLASAAVFGTWEMLKAQAS